MNLDSTLRVGLLTTALLGVAACSSDPDPAPGEPSGAACDVAVPTCPGSTAPTWAATDVQPKSARFNEAYGLEAFRGKVVLVAFLSAWCPYCRAQAALLEKMREELAAEGVADVQMVIVNSTDAVADQANFVAVTSFPLFQDSDDALVFRKHRTAKDDFALYDRDGKLLRFYGASSARDLQKSEIYEAVKAELEDTASR